MAFIAFAEFGGAGLAQSRFAAPIAPGSEPICDRTTTEQPRLSALEWLVVAIARRDRLSSLRTPGRMAMALGTLFGNGRNPRLADPRLEALRRIAVLSWRRGYTVPGHEVRAFLAAGYTPEQYELVVDSISKGLANERNGRGR